MEALGVDIGGSGIKAARVDTRTGELLTERLRVPTPAPSTPRAVAGAIRDVVARLGYEGPAGCGFPGVVKAGVVLTAANVSKKWIGVAADELLEQATGLSFVIRNDADLAGLAEMRLGAGRGRKGLVVMLTFGTGIGTAFFLDGKLVPNVELGHLEIDGREAERWASDRARLDEDLGWKRWSRRVNVFLARLHAYFWPDLIIIGGGASKKYDKFSDYLEAPCELRPAALRNHAGIIGGALAAVPGRGIRGQHEPKKQKRGT